MSEPDPSVMAYVALKDATAELRTTLVAMEEASRAVRSASAQVLESTALDFPTQ